MIQPTITCQQYSIINCYLMPICMCFFFRVALKHLNKWTWTVERSSWVAFTSISIRRGSHLVQGTALRRMSVSKDSIFTQSLSPSCSIHDSKFLALFRQYESYFTYDYLRSPCHLWNLRTGTRVSWFLDLSPGCFLVPTPQPVYLEDPKQLPKP